MNHDTPGSGDSMLCHDGPLCSLHHSRHDSLTMETKSATALFALIGALSPQPMHAFAARMGSSALLPTLVRTAPSSLTTKPTRCVRAAVYACLRLCCRHVVSSLATLSVLRVCRAVGVCEMLQSCQGKRCACCASSASAASAGGYFYPFFFLPCCSCCFARPA